MAGAFVERPGSGRSQTFQIEIQEPGVGALVGFGKRRESDQKEQLTHLPRRNS